MWNSWASLNSLVVPSLTKELPGLPQAQDDDNPSPAKQQKMSKSLEDFSLPPDMRRAYATESARLQAMQTEIPPYQPTSAVRKSPGQCPPEPENDRRMYVPSLSQSLTRRDIFAYFCAFGDLERVCVKNGVDSLNYAIVIFCRTASMHLAIAANPHSIKGHRLLCRKAAEKSPGQAVKPTKPTKPAREDNPLPQALTAKPSETEPKKQPRKSDLQEPKMSLISSSSRREDLRNFITKLKENLMPSRKSVVPRKGDQTFVYSAAETERNSRWRFSLAGSYTTQEEKEALKEGHPDAAKKLLRVRAERGQNSSTKPIKFIKPTAPVKTQKLQNYPSSISEPIPNSPRVPVSLPPPSPSRQILLSSQEDRVLISKPDPVPVVTAKQKSSVSNANPVPFILPPPLNLEFPKPKDLKGISYFGPEFRYEHHCYTNVVAYERTKLYIDLGPGEREKRKTIKEFMDHKYGANIIK